MVEPTKNGPNHEPKNVATNRPSWDSFFNGGPCVSPDFLEERASQDGTNLPLEGGRKAAPKLANLMAEMPFELPRVGS